MAFGSPFGFFGPVAGDGFNNKFRIQLLYVIGGGVLVQLEPIDLARSGPQDFAPEGFGVYVQKHDFPFARLSGAREWVHALN